MASRNGRRFDVAYGAADFDDDDIHSIGDFAKRGFDFIGDVRNHLHGLAEIIAAALFRKNGFVDAPGGPVVIARQLRVGEALVVAEIEIGFGAVIGDENFAVLIRTHRAGINVQVGIALLEGDLEAAAFEQTAHRSRRYAFSERRNHAARYEDILRAASQVSEIPPLRCAYNALSGESPRVSNPASRRR